MPASLSARLLLVLAALAVTGLGAAPAAPGSAPVVRLAGIFADSMVLQREKPVRVWGWAAPDAEVRVAFAGQEQRATADVQGRWLVTLDPMPASDAGRELVVRPAGTGPTVAITNVLVGEVWLCSGQSNMQLGLAAANGQGPVQEANYPAIRLFTTAFSAPAAPAADCQGRWLVCGPATVGAFSAVAYYFGRELHRELGVPVGLIVSAHGATAAESWISLEALAAEPVLKPIAERFAAMPKDPKGWDPHLPTGLFNGEIAPLTPLSLRGVAWYQGESNASRGWQYRMLFPALIRDWRRAWGEELPFLFVQLANHLEPAPQPAEEPWAELREAQALALALPATGMAVAIDIGAANNIHPPNKWDIGRRLALWALAKCHGRVIVCSGPLYRAMQVEDNRIRLAFDHVGGGLVARDGPLKHFAIAAADGPFVWADAVIDGDSVVVSSTQVPHPAAVRYAWANNPDGCNLFNKAGLPAAPFRTDSRPGVTDNAHLAQPAATPAPAARTIAPIDPTAPLTGNTLQIAVGRTVERTWPDVKLAGYEYRPKQAATPAGETRIWLPYGKVRGAYHEITGFELTDTAPGQPAAVVSQDAQSPGRLVLKLHFDRPIDSFRLACGYTVFTPGQAVAGLEYSVDGRTWTTLRETAQGGIINRLADPAQARAEHLRTQELLIRYYVRNRADATRTEGAHIKTWMGGDPMWGDAATTFFQSQWQLWVTPAV